MHVDIGNLQLKKLPRAIEIAYRYWLCLRVVSSFWIVASVLSWGQAPYAKAADRIRGARFSERVLKSGFAKFQIWSQEDVRIFLQHCVRSLANFHFCLQQHVHLPVVLQ